MEVSVTSECTCLMIELNYPRIPNLTYNFQVQVNIFKQLPSMQQHQVYTKSFLVPKNHLRIEGLDDAFMYKVQALFKYASEPWTNPKQVFHYLPKQYHSDQEDIDEQLELPDIRANLRQYFEQYGAEQPLRRPRAGSKAKVKPTDYSSSEMFLKTIGQAANIGGPKKLERMILDGRKCRNTTEFINQREGKRTDPQGVAQRKQLLVKGMLTFLDTYSQKEGMHYFKNDWCMGPFYSYDLNEDTLKKI